MSTRPDRIAAWVAAALGVALTAALFWPGLMSVDSAVQYAQAIGLRPLDDVHPPLMTLLWRVVDRAAAGPGGLFLVFCVAWWSGLAAVVAQYPLRRGVAFGLVLLVGFFPATFLMLGHVWKDVAMAAALLLASAASLAHHRAPKWRWRWLALLALVIAACLRHNALFAALPLLAWRCWPRASSPSSATDASTASRAPTLARGTLSRGMLSRAAAFALLALMLAVAPAALAGLARAERTQAWTVVALWDIAALSVDAGRVLVPASVTFGELSIDDLRHAYVDYANPPLFDLGTIQLSLYAPYSHAQLADLRDAWLAAIADDPAAYLQHRARLSRYLLLGFPARVPRDLVYVPDRRVLPGTPLALPAVDETSPYWRAMAALRSTPLFAGATYLALALIAAWLVRRHPDAAHRGLVTALSASSWANALPLLLISGSAEFRYLAWSALAAVLAVALAIAGRRVQFG